jgi:hypothetical protein
MHEHSLAECFGAKQMNRSAALVFALILIVLAVFSGNGDAMIKSSERALAWGVGREIAHSLFHGER